MSEVFQVSYKNILRIAFPVMIGGLSFTLVNLTDTLFLSQLGEAELGGAGNAVLLFAIFVQVGMGFSTGAQIVLARRNGEGDYHAIGKIVQHTLFFLGFYTLFTYATLQFVLPHITSVFISDEEVRMVLHQFIEVRSWGIFFFCINMTFMAFYVGTTKTKIIGLLTPLTAITNIFLDYGLVFGEFGFPEMGVAGAALASNLAEVLATLIYVSYTFFIHDHKTYKLFSWQKIDFSELKNLIKISSPVMVQNFIALVAWFLFFTIIEHLGKTELATSHVIRSIYMVLIIPIFGVGDTVNSLTGNLLGQKAPEKVMVLLKKTNILGFAYALALQPVFYLWGDWLFKPFAAENINLEMGIPALQVVFAALFLFTTMIIGFRVISGAGKTLLGMVMEIFTVAFYLLLAWYISNLNNVELWQVWSSEFIYFALFVILVYLYLWKGNWRESKLS